MGITNGDGPRRHAPAKIKLLWNEQGAQLRQRDRTFHNILRGMDVCDGAIAWHLRLEQRPIVDFSSILFLLAPKNSLCGFLTTNSGRQLL